MVGCWDAPQHGTACLAGQLAPLAGMLLQQVLDCSMPTMSVYQLAMICARVVAPVLEI